MSLWDVGKRLIPKQLYGILWPLSRTFRTNRLIRREVQKSTDRRVASGPFMGMRYAENSTGSVYCPKLLGTYEIELWPMVREILSIGYETVIDIGAAEGYYAVGLAYKMPGAKVIAFEAAEKEHHLLQSMVDLNGVSQRVKIRGFCTPAALAESFNAPGRTLVFCDVEGAEGDLLQPETIAQLKKADVLVELHDFLRPGVGALVEKRFAGTHQITKIRARDRQIGDWPAGTELEDRYRLMAMDEHRPAQMHWLWMRARDTV